MSIVTGRYGDTHVPPALLDPRSVDGVDSTIVPPADAIDVQFRVPVSLSLLLDRLARDGGDSWLDAWAHGYRMLVAGLLPSVQRAGGYALKPGDIAAPARLALGSTIHHTVPGIAEARWHCHVWIGATAATIGDEEQHPIAVDEVSEGVQSVVFAAYSEKLEELATTLLDARWESPRPAAPREIAGVPSAGERGVCPGRPGGATHLVLADETHLAVSARMQQQMHQADGGQVADVPQQGSAPADRARAWVAALARS